MEHKRSSLLEVICSLVCRRSLILLRLIPAPERSCSVNGLSSIVDQNAAVAAEMRATTETVAATVSSATTSAQEQSQTAELVAAVSELEAEVRGVDDTAEGVRAEAERLANSVQTFTIDERTQASRPSSTLSRPALRRPALSGSR